MADSRRLLNEARLQAQLSSPHVVQVLGCFLHNDQPVLAMEFVDGPSLRGLLRQTAMDQEAMDQIARGICVGVAAAHEAGLIHRDLKPSNILIADPNGRPYAKVTDFGLVQERVADGRKGDLLVRGRIEGTPGYIAPELLAEDPPLPSERTDVFSLGAVLYHLCTGRKAFTGPDRFTVLHKSWLGRYTPPLELHPDLPIRMARAIEAALEPDPARRVPDVASLRRLWSEGGGTSAFVRGRPPQVEDDDDDESDVSQTVVLSTRSGLVPLGGLPPLHAGSSLGREADHRALMTQVATPGVVTITGSGGVGKTRLAVELARRMGARLSGRAWFCDLSEARSRVGVVLGVAAALGTPLLAGDTVELVGHSLRGRGPALLILDNGEQILEPLVSVIELWREAAPEACFLVTSRMPLGIEGERVHRLDPLDLEDAARLFMDRAGRVAPDAALAGLEPAQVAALVERLGGLPLAIELAASRLGELSVDTLLASLDEGIAEIRSGVRSRSHRQSTLEATLAWSWRLLWPWQKLALAQCSVFRGGFTLEAAEAVVDVRAWAEAPSVMDLMHSLADHHLISARQDPAGSRLVLSEAVRSFARDRLEEPRAVVRGLRGPLTGPEALQSARLRHARHFATRGRGDALAALSTHGGVRRYAALSVEAANLDAAIQWSLDAGESRLAAECARARAVIYDRQGPMREGAAMIGRVLETGLDAPALRCGLMIDQASLMASGGRLADARALFEQVADAARRGGHRRLAVRALSGVAAQSGVLGDSTRAWAAAQEAVGLAVAAKDRPGEALARGMLARELERSGRLTEAIAEERHVLRLRRTLGDRRGVGSALGNLAATLSTRGDVKEARRRLEEALVHHREVGNRRSEAHVYAELAKREVELGRMDAARLHSQAGLRLSRELGLRRREGRLLLGVGTRLALEGDVAGARETLDQALVIHRAVGDRINEAIALANLSVVLRMDGDLDAAQEWGQASLDRAEAMGEVIGVAIATGNLGEVAYARGDLVEARRLLDAAIEGVGEVSAPIAGAYRGLIAVIHAREGDLEGAWALIKQAESEIGDRYAAELGKVTCRRGEVALIGGRRDLAVAALAQAQRMASAAGSGPRSELGLAVAALAAALD